jgi:hypothetical protein
LIASNRSCFEVTFCDEKLQIQGVPAVETSFGVLDAFAFVVFAVLIFVAVIVAVSLGKLPGELAGKWGHPQAAAINVMSWIGIATGGLLWPVALIWAFTNPSGANATIKDDRQPHSAVEADATVRREAALKKISGDIENRP